MADLQDTSLPDITVGGAFNGGNLSSSPIGVSGYKSDGGAQNTVAGPIQFNGITTNVGGISLSNGNSRFTVPYDGYYVMWFKNIGNSVGSTSITYFRVNGSNIECRAYSRNAEYNYAMSLGFTIINLAQGDYLEYYKDTTAMYQNTTTYVNFGIYRIGG